MLRLCRVFLVVAAIVAVTAPSAAAVPDRKLSGLLGHMWTTILETPDADNPVTDGDPCIQLGANIVAPFGGGLEFTCVVKPGTRVFVAAYSAECSTVEDPPFHGDNEDELRSCARANVEDFEAVTATLDGRPIALTQVQTALLNFVLPPDNIFGLEAGTTGQSVGTGGSRCCTRSRPGRTRSRSSRTGPTSQTRPPSRFNPAPDASATPGTGHGPECGGGRRSSARRDAGGAPGLPPRGRRHTTRRDRPERPAVSETRQWA